MRFLLVVVTGALGGLCRYVVSGVVQRSSRSDLPVGTLCVNLFGAILLGLVAGTDDLQSMATLAAGGFLSGFTTYSTWMIETIRLGMPPINRGALTNLALNLLAGVALAAAGYSLTN
ncbi:MAG: CrcB family protein [Acidimicrobiia bacterium]